MTQAASVQFSQVAVCYSHGNTVVHHLDLHVEHGEFVSILGPSGCGKSTVLKAAAGIQQISNGFVSVGGRKVTEPNRECGFVFQQETLFPWHTVRRNVEFGLRLSRIGRAERRGIVDDALQQMGLAEFAGVYPAQLSGGMKQRVELARVLVNNPKVLLMDEPFGALDAQTRLRMQKLLLEIWERNRIAVLFVTHDVDEALLLSDRVVILSDRPATIKHCLAVDIPRPRATDHLMSPAFNELKKICFQQLSH